MNEKKIVPTSERKGITKGITSTLNLLGFIYFCIALLIGTGAFVSGCERGTFGMYLHRDHCSAPYERYTYIFPTYFLGCEIGIGTGKALAWLGDEKN